MASVYRDSARNGYRAQVVVRGVRRKLWVGDVSASAARAIADHLERLKMAAETGTHAPADSVRWSRVVNDRIRKQLAHWGLIELGVSSDATPRTLDAWIGHYLASRTDIKPRTRARLENSRRHLTAIWPPETALRAITPGDCDQYARKIRARFKPAHSGKLIADARQFFAAAVRQQLIADNPWAGVDCSQPHDRARERYISPADASKLLAQCQPTLAAVVALARFGGLRVPSEPLALTWAAIDWENGRIRVVAPKTSNSRVIPMFPELKKHLENLFDAAPAGETYVFPAADRRRARNGGHNCSWPRPALAWNHGLSSGKTCGLPAARIWKLNSPGSCAMPGLGTRA